MSATAIARSLTLSTYETVRKLVLTCELRPGARINVKELAESLDTNVGALREALSRLTAEELIVAEPQKGFRVAAISVQDLQDLTAARIEIEGTCLRRSIANGDVAWEVAVVAAFHRLSKTESPLRGGHVPVDWSYAHTAFHEALVSACENTWLRRFRIMLFEQNARYRALSVSITGDKRDLESEHRALMDAALKRDADAAVASMEAHIMSTTNALLIRMSTAE